MVLYMIFLALHCTVVHAQNFYQYHLSSVWYQQGKHLKVQLNNLHEQALSHFDCAIFGSSVRAIIVPHAAYQYSGVIAASAYRTLEQDFFSRVIILAPSHFASFEGVALPSPQYSLYKSRLGFVNLDTAALQQLASHPSQLFHARHMVHDKDHAIEMQVPLIQKYCGQCAIVPLLIGQLSAQQLKDVVQGLRSVVDRTTLIVVSSDMVHFGASFGYTPFSENIAERIANLDNAVAATLQDINPSGFTSLVRDTGATVCGSRAIACLLELLQPDKAELTAYVTGYDRSAGEQKNPDHSVSYLGMVFATKKRQDLPLQDRLTGYEKNFLLRIAREALANLDAAEQTEVFSGILTQPLRQHAGVFVTLKTAQGNLRGCMGRVHADVPIYQLVYAMTREAARHDMRFSSVSEQEAGQLGVEISVLTTPRDVPSYQAIDVETDGVIVRQGGHDALFLPEVATSHGWSLSTMLSQLCLKAGLPGDAWQREGYKTSMMFQVFRAIHIE